MIGTLYAESAALYVVGGNKLASTLVSLPHSSTVSKITTLTTTQGAGIQLLHSG